MSIRTARQRKQQDRERLLAVAVVWGIAITATAATGAGGGCGDNLGPAHQAAVDARGVADAVRTAPTDAAGEPTGKPTDAAPTAVVDATGDDVLPHGRLAIRIRTLSPALPSNCGFNTGNGQITDMAVRVTRSDGTCANIKLARSAVEGVSYTTDCTGVTTTRCLSETDVLSTDDAIVDTYTIRASGYVGTRQCWLGEVTVDAVPGSTTIAEIGMSRFPFSECIGGPITHAVGSGA